MSAPLNVNKFHSDARERVRRIHENSPVPIRPVDGRLQQGRRAWNALHLKALSNEITVQWLRDDFRPMIPRFNCACLKEWDKLLVEMPFQPENQFEWSVKVHNYLNIMLGKSVISLDDARYLGFDIGIVVNESLL